MKFLIVNTGSTSKKYAFYMNNKEVFRAHLEKEPHEYVAHIMINGQEGKITISHKDFQNPHKNLFDLLHANRFVSEINDIDVIAIRIVAPGRYFANHYKINEHYIKKLKDAMDIVPLHIHSILLEIDDLQNAYPGIPLLGISDSNFHKNLPSHSKYYAVPKHLAEKFDIQRFGYHGISINSILFKLKQSLKTLPLRIIVCHLGGGASITAVKNGESFDTSMGFSPLEGLMMATRVGDIDAGAVLYLAKKFGGDIEKLEHYLNYNCGLLGLSTISPDLRELFEEEKSGNQHAKIAVETYVYKIKKYIGSYAAGMNGLDLLVFTGTIGERSNIIRERVCNDLDFLGVTIDHRANDKVIGKDGFIHRHDSKVAIAVVQTDEMGEMAREIKGLL